MWFNQSEPWDKHEYFSDSETTPCQSFLSVLPRDSLEGTRVGCTSFKSRKPELSGYHLIPCYPQTTFIFISPLCFCWHGPALSTLNIIFKHVLFFYHWMHTCNSLPAIHKNLQSYLKFITQYVEELPVCDEFAFHFSHLGGLSTRASYVLFMRQ